MARRGLAFELTVFRLLKEALGSGRLAWISTDQISSNSVRGTAGRRVILAGILRPPLDALDDQPLSRMVRLGPGCTAPR